MLISEHLTRITGKRGLTLALFSLSILPHARAQMSGGSGIGGFGGPAVLGRGASGSGVRSAEAGFRFYAGANVGYDNGLTGFALDANGNVQNAGSRGVEGVAGVYGTRRARRSLISLNYQGGYRHYTNIQRFNGADQHISLQTSRQLTARSAVGLGITAGTTNRAFGINSFNGFVDPNALAFGVPTSEVFDNRIYYGSGSVNYIWQRSARSSISMTGNGFLTRRTGRVLFGANGAGAGLDYAYRLTRNQTISIGYNYFFFNYTRGFGDAQGNGVFAGYATRIARKYDIAFRGGGIRMEKLYLQRVAVDPVIAAIVGIGSTQQVSYDVSYLPTGTLSISGPVTRRSNFNLTSGLFVVPGNGIITTSRNWNAGGSYSYTGMKRLGFGASVFWNEMSSLIGTSQKFSSINSSVNISPRLGDEWHMNITAGNRRFLEGPTNNFRRNSYFVQMGIFWSPGELPLNIR